MPTKRTNNIQTQIVDGGRTEISWLNIINAGQKEIEHLSRTYHFDRAHLYRSAANVSAGHAVVHAGEDYVFVVQRFPYFDRKESVIAGEEVDFFIGKDYIITLHGDKVKALGKLFSNYNKENTKHKVNADSPADVFYHIMERLLEHSFDLLDNVGETSDEVEDTIFTGDTKHAITTLLNLRRSAINMHLITRSYADIFEKFERLRREAGINDARTPFPLVNEKARDLLNTVENRKEVIEALYATNESISNYRLNDIMKTLTIFSVIVFPLTLLAAIFGMNTMNGMPFVDTPQGFWVIIIIMLLGSFGMLLFFKKKRWI